MIKQQPRNLKYKYFIRGSRGLVFPVKLRKDNGNTIEWESFDGSRNGTCHRSDLIEELVHQVSKK